MKRMLTKATGLKMCAGTGPELHRSPVRHLVCLMHSLYCTVQSHLPSKNAVPNVPVILSLARNEMIEMTMSFTAW